MKVSATAKVFRDKDGQWQMTLQGRPFALSQIVTFFRKKDEEEFSVDVDFIRKRVSKTLPQLGYVYGALYPALVNLYKVEGYRRADVGSMDALMRMNYFFEEFVNEETGQVFKIPKSIAQSTKEEMTEYIESIIQHEFLEHFGVSAPDPKEYYGESKKIE
jgi:hypothetical protein